MFGKHSIVSLLSSRVNSVGDASANNTPYTIKLFSCLHSKSKRSWLEVEKNNSRVVFQYQFLDPKMVNRFTSHMHGCAIQPTVDYYRFGVYRRLW